MSCGVYEGSQVQFEVIEHKSVMVSMRDGAHLATDIYLPAIDGKVADGTFPVILERTPYDNGNPELTATGRYFAKRGYVCVLQDVRGRGESDGDWKGLVLSTNEADDGFDTCKWAVEQPWSDGQIGTIGLSYTGSTQHALAVRRPPGLKAQFIMDSGYNYHTHTIRSGGAFVLGVMFPYAFRMAMGGKEARKDPVVAQALKLAADNLTEYLKFLPVSRGDTALALAPTYENMLFALATHADYDDLWKDPVTNLQEHVDEYPDVPVMSTTTWYGHHLWASTTRFNDLHQRMRSPIRLIIGTWLHSVTGLVDTWTGEVDFGMDAMLDNLNDLRLKWFDQHLKGMHTDVLNGPPISIFVMGGGTGRKNAAGHMDHGGFWRHEYRWPLDGTTFDNYYLHGGGGLRTSEPSPNVLPSRFTFDPKDPVPTIGGGVQPPRITTNFIAIGAYDQRGRPDLAVCNDTMPIALRQDVLVFETMPLGNDTEVTGPVEVNLWAASSASDTDFTAKLVDVYPPNTDYPEGFAMNLCDGIIRARYRNSRERQELLESGKVYRFRIDLQGTGNIFQKGHRIRLEISSSNFPHYDVNPNTGAPLWESAETHVAHQAIYHDSDHPSHIVLPVIVSSDDH
ncbi:CocE/NonD family hydrolase [SAR202 cluster bacterium AD-804-J14_MRT_500m]|nr:CocE/NonD family hydrolase [SAR202 cluster bacterium AD-804-J14_MRT_500m]